MDFEAVIPERFRCKYDALNDRWLVLDMWHPQIKNLPKLDESIPEDSPALKIITGTEMSALLGEMQKIGYLDKIIKVPAKESIMSESDVLAREKALIERMDTFIDLISNKEGKKREKKAILNI